MGCRFFLRMEVGGWGMGDGNSRVFVLERLQYDRFTHSSSAWTSTYLNDIGIISRGTLDGSTLGSSFEIAHTPDQL